MLFVFSEKKMKTLLRIDVSVRKNESISRSTGDYFQSRWREAYPDSKIIYRDLTDEPIPHLSQKLTEAFYDEENNRDVLSLSDKLISELDECDTLLISSPVYNFSLPSALKAYFDHVVRINKTFKNNETGGFTGLLKNKQAIVITSKGGVYKGTSLAPFDFLEPYVNTILRFIGIHEIRTFSIEGTRYADHAEKAIAAVKLDIRESFNIPKKALTGQE
jgi:FMN-dependent NADH-azoreductase